MFYYSNSNKTILPFLAEIILDSALNHIQENIIIHYIKSKKRIQKEYNLTREKRMHSN